MPNTRLVAMIVAALVAGRCPGAALGETATPSATKLAIQDALINVVTLERPGKDGIATMLDGNKFVQCRPMPDRTLRCESAGILMQPSMARVLTPAKIARLGELGWTLDSSFGNFVRIFPSDMPADRVADAVIAVLGQGYDADFDHLGIATHWIASEPCPPRSGPRQNLAGSINAAPSMAGVVIHTCAYKAPPNLVPQPMARSAQDLIETYGARVTGEIGRLRVNSLEAIHVVFDTDVGYIQCAPDGGTGIYCEAASAESWPVLAGVLTPVRVDHLHAAGFADPGHSPNFDKTYRLDAFDNAAIARQLLTILYDVYGYDGAKKLTIETE